MTINATQTLLTYLLPLGLTALACWLLGSLGSLRFALSSWIGIITGYLGSYSYNLWQRLSHDEQNLGGIWSSLSDAFWRLTFPKLDVQWVPLAISVALAVTVVMHWTNSSSKKVIRFTAFTLMIFALNTLLIAMILWNSLHLAENKSLVLRSGNVLIPGLLLTLIWVGPLLRTRNRGLIPQPNADLESSTPKLASPIGWLAALALPLSATLLLASSGTLSLAFKALIPAIIPLAQFYQRKSQHNVSVMAAGWISLAVCLPVILGHFFAEVSVWQAVLIVVSSFLTLWQWPEKSHSLVKQWGISFACVLPALIAAGVAALTLVAQMQGESPDGY